MDSTDPVFSVRPADATVECDDVPLPPVVTASDTCDPAFDPTPAVLEVEERIDGGCPSNYTLTRTWSTEDACSNTVSHVQTIVVHDTTPPVIQACPANDFINICNENITDAPTLFAVDNCDAIFMVDDPECCFDGVGITRTWTATDLCGNQAIPSVQEIAFTPACAA